MPFCRRVAETRGGPPEKTVPNPGRTLMKASKVLAVVLTSLAFTGCISKEMAPQAGPVHPVADDPTEERRVVVAHLLEAHHETVGQMRVSSALQQQPPASCN
jgi:hypothetical protein